MKVELSAIITKNVWKKKKRKNKKAMSMNMNMNTNTNTAKGTCTAWSARCAAISTKKTARAIAAAACNHSEHT